MAVARTRDYTSIPGVHFVLKSRRGDEAQQQCVIHGVVHFKITNMSCTAVDPRLLVSRWQLLRNSLHSGMHQDAAFSGSSDTCSADPARFGTLIRLSAQGRRSQDVEILDPGLLLDRIGGTRVSRRDASLVTQITSEFSRIIHSDAEDLEADVS